MGELNRSSVEKMSQGFENLERDRQKAGRDVKPQAMKRLARRELEPLAKRLVEHPPSQRELARFSQEQKEVLNTMVLAEEYLKEAEKVELAVKAEDAHASAYHWAITHEKGYLIDAEGTLTLRNRDQLEKPTNVAKIKLEEVQTKADHYIRTLNEFSAKSPVVNSINKTVADLRREVTLTPTLHEVEAGITPRTISHLEALEMLTSPDRATLDIGVAAAKLLQDGGGVVPILKPEIEVEELADQGSGEVSGVEVEGDSWNVDD